MASCVSSRDYATYELVGGSEFSNPASLIGVFLGDAGIDSVNALWTQTAPDQTVSSDAAQSSEYQEFTADFKGEAVHGLVHALTDMGTGFNTDSYDAEGPNGPGYYYNDQRLNIISRPT